MRKDILNFLSSQADSAREVIQADTAREVIQADTLTQLLEYSSYLLTAKITITVTTEDGQVATGTFDNHAQLNYDLQSAMNHLIEDLITD